MSSKAEDFSVFSFFENNNVQGIVLKLDPVIDLVQWSGHGSDGLTRINKKKYLYKTPN